MHTSLDSLLKRLKEVQEDDEFDLPELADGWPSIRYGSKLLIEWVMLEEVDIGYVFVLPGHLEPHETDAIFTEGIVHIPNPVGGEKCAAEPEWQLLYDLIMNPNVKRIDLADGGPVYVNPKPGL